MKPQDLAQMLLINLIWGFFFIAAKFSLAHFPPLMFTAIRFALLLAVLFPWLKIHRGQMKPVLATAMALGVLTFGFIFAGLALSDASVVAVASQLGVPFSVLLSALVFGEKAGARRWLGIAIAFAGVMIIVFDPSAFRFLTGMMLVMAGVFCGSSAAVFQRQIKDVGLFQLMAWVAALATPIMIVLSLVFEAGQVELLQSADWSVWAGCLYVAYASTLIGDVGYYALLRRYDVSLTAPLVLLTPVFAVGLSVLLLGDVLTTRMIAGAAVVLTGVLLVSLPDRTAARIADAQSGSPK
ncbi:MAG: EamA family transporter [Alphaproteobacteria bacterium]|nr:EamA family transporter [Alphaproteobacteria bacterium]